MTVLTGTQTLLIRDWLPEPLSNVSADHWRKRERKLKAAQVMVWASAKQAGLVPVVGRALVHIELVFPVKRRRDADGLHSRIKGVLDGLVRGGWIEDDSIDHIDLRVSAVVMHGIKATRISLEAVS